MKVKSQVPRPSPDLVQGLINRSAIVIVGSGTSIPSGAPSWEQLMLGIAAEAAERCSTGDRQKVSNALLQIRENRHSDAASILKRVLGDSEFRTAIVRQILFDRDNTSLENLDLMLSENKRPQAGQSLKRELLPTLTHLIVAQLPFRVIVTTNYDTIIEDAWVKVHRKQIPSYSRSYRHFGARLQDRDQFVFKLHGDIHHREDIVLAREDYAELVNDRAIQEPLRNLFGTSKILWIGYGHQDPDLDLLIDSAATSLGLHGGYSIAREEDYRLAARFQSVKVSPIWLPDYDNLPEFLLNLFSEVCPGERVSVPIHFDLHVRDSTEANLVVQKFTEKLERMLNGDVGFDSIERGSVKANLRMLPSSLKELQSLRSVRDLELSELLMRFRVSELAGRNVDDTGDGRGDVFTYPNDSPIDASDGLKPQPVMVAAPPSRKNTKKGRRLRKACWTPCGTRVWPSRYWFRPPLATAMTTVTWWTQCRPTPSNSSACTRWTCLATTRWSAFATGVMRA